MKKEILSETPQINENDSTTDDSDISMPNTSKKPKKVFRKVLTIVVLLSVSALVYFSLQTYTQEKRSDDVYSADQQRIISEFGLPDTFQIVNESGSDETSMRSEIWHYLKLEEVFLFENGKFSARTHQDFNLSDTDSLVTIRIQPADVYNLMTLEEINQLLGGEPNYSADINPEILTNAQIHNYDNLVAVGLIDNQVSWIRTFAGVNQADDMLVDEKATTDEKATKGEVPHLTDDEWKKGRVFSEDEQFSIFVDMDVAQNLVALKELQNEAYTHHFCYGGEDIEQDFFCNGWGRPLFTIVEYSEEDYQEFLQSTLADSELVLARRDGKVYTFSHPNGDVPAIIMGRADDFYAMVIESFVFTNEM